MARDWNMAKLIPPQTWWLTIDDHGQKQCQLQGQPNTHIGTVQGMIMAKKEGHGTQKCQSARGHESTICHRTGFLVMSLNPITCSRAPRPSAAWNPSPQLRSSASVVEDVTKGCLPESHKTGDPPRFAVVPVTDLWSSCSSAKLLSVQTSSWRWMLFSLKGGCSSHRT